VVDGLRRRNFKRRELVADAERQQPLVRYRHGNRIGYHVLPLTRRCLRSP